MRGKWYVHHSLRQIALQPGKPFPLGSPEQPQAGPRKLRYFFPQIPSPFLFSLHPTQPTNNHIPLSNNVDPYQRIKARPLSQ